MSKALIAGAVVIGAVVFAKRQGTEPRGIRHREVHRADARQRPPKWAFQNITAIRANTDRILELLDSQHKAGTGEAAMPLHDEEST